MNELPHRPSSFCRAAHAGGSAWQSSWPHASHSRPASRKGCQDERTRPGPLQHMEKLKQAIEEMAVSRERVPAEPMRRASLRSPIRIRTCRWPDRCATRCGCAPRQEGLSHGKGRPGSWVTVGPSQALYPFTESATPSATCPTPTSPAARRRLSRSTRACASATAASGSTPRRRRVAHQERPGRPAELAVLSGDFGIQSGSFDGARPNDPTGNTLYVGWRGERLGRLAAGVGMYKSTDGGDTGTGPLERRSLAAGAIGSIVVKPGDPVRRSMPGHTRRPGRLVGERRRCVAHSWRGPWGLYGPPTVARPGRVLHNGRAARFTVRHGDGGYSRRLAVLDPRRAPGRAGSDQTSIVYAGGSYVRGSWRSTDGGATWTQISRTLASNPAHRRDDEAELAVATLPSGKTRMYVYEGSAGSPTARLFRSDDVARRAGLHDLSSPATRESGYGTHNVCTGQCWYDNFVYMPAGHPDVVYVGGSYSYGEAHSNKRGSLFRPTRASPPPHDDGRHRHLPSAACTPTSTRSSP